MVESRGDDAVRPGALGFQLVHLLAGIQAVLTHVDPVVGAGGQQDGEPADAADQEAAHLETRVGHEERESVHPVDPEARLQLRHQHGSLREKFREEKLLQNFQPIRFLVTTEKKSCTAPLNTSVLLTDQRNLLPSADFYLFYIFFTVSNLI